MAISNYTQSTQAIYNEFDRFGLLLELPRLDGEKNAEYKKRLFDVFVHRSNSTYLGLIYSITRELGLSIFEAIDITALTDEAVITFDETKCYVYSNLADDTLIETLDRFEINDGNFTYSELIDNINATGYFSASLCDGIDGNYRAMTIYNQSNTILVPNEDLFNSARIKLQYSNIIEDSIVLRSSNINEHVHNSEDLIASNQYYIDTTNGIFYSGSAPADGSSIRYKYQLHNFKALASPIILHNLQSEDFKTKMFQQVLQEDGTYINSLPTSLGADIINELYSVYPSLLGK